MERYLDKIFPYRKPIDSGVINILESQVNIFVSELSPGETNTFLLDVKDKGLFLYHHGPEKKVVRGNPFAQEVPTGNEYVFIQYYNGKDYYQLVGSVSNHRFTLIRLDQYKPGKSYHPVNIDKNLGVIQTVTHILQEISSTRLAHNDDV